MREFCFEAEIANNTSAHLVLIEIGWYVGFRSDPSDPIRGLRNDAGTGDVLTGLLTVPVAIALVAGAAEGQKGAIFWNIFGLADLAVAIALGMIITPGPFQLIVLHGPSIGLDNYPNVMTPGFVVPCSILLHALSLRQLRRRSLTDVTQR